MKAILSCLLLVTLFVFLQAKLVPTPYGLRPEQCVTRGVPSGSFIEEVDEGVLIHHPTGEKHLVPKDQECIDYQNKFMETRKNRTFSLSEKGEVNGWLDYTGWYPPTNDEVVSFTGDYIVPGDPASNSGQVLFYFIGTQNNQGSTVTILQPVLTWGNGLNGWSFASWNCCPSGQQQESNPIQGFGAGDTLQGAIQASGGNWVITSTANGQSTQLNVADADRDFDWVDVTLEVYSVNTCDQFASGPMTFENMVITVANAGQVSADWAVTNPNTCNGVLDVVSPSDITITF